MCQNTSGDIQTLFTVWQRKVSFLLERNPVQLNNPIVTGNELDLEGTLCIVMQEWQQKISSKL